MVHGINEFEDETSNSGIQTGKGKRNVKTEKKSTSV